MRTLIITISLISLILCADSCSSKTQEQCTSDSSCTWTAGKCSGDSATTCSSVTVEATCKTTTYTGTGIKCQFTPAVAATCTGTINCASLNSAEKCGHATGCAWDETSTACSGTSTKTCADFASDGTKCAAVGCTYSEPVAAKCEGDATCNSHASSSSDCTGTTYSGSSTCTWTAPSCSTKNTNNDPNNNDDDDDDSGVTFIKISKVIFAIFALLF